MLNTNERDERNVKRTIILAGNKIMDKHKLAHFDDSTSSITTKTIHFIDIKTDVYFSIDICAVVKYNGN